eukprot:4042353-Amphidinium_carterae.1
MATSVIIATFPAKPTGMARAPSVPPGGPPRGQSTTPSAPAASAPLPVLASGASPAAAPTDVDVESL